MSVDFRTCDVCGETRHEDFVASCEACGNNICNECANKTVHDFRNEDGEVRATDCPFCKGEVVDPAMFLDYLEQEFSETIDFDCAREDFKRKMRETVPTTEPLIDIE